MINSLRRLSVGVTAAVLLLSSSSAWAQSLKVGVVDMNKIFNQYYRTKEAEQSINQAREAARKELEERMGLYQKEMEAVKKLQEQAQSQTLSESLRKQKQELFAEKVEEIRKTEKEIAEFRTQREKQINDQMLRIRNSIVEEIIVLVQEKVKSDSFDLVIDKSGMSMNGVGLVLYSRPDMDFSDSIIEKLNKNRPAGAATATPAPAETPKK